MAELGKYMKSMGQKALVLWGPNAHKLFEKQIQAALDAEGIELVSCEFSGQCDKGQVEAGLAKAKAEGVDLAIGVGGGKAMDLVKAIAVPLKLGVVCVPTLASTDAATSAFTVYYDEDGLMVGWDIWPYNPDLVLVDTKVIADAPVKWFKIGIADGLATWLEAEASHKGRYPTFSGGVATMAALAFAKLCYDTLLEFGVDASRDVENHVVTPAVERVVEANTLLSGIGWESGGVASAHAVGLASGAFGDARHYSHGERVSFGIVTQMCLDEDICVTQRNQIVDFLVSLDLPVTLEEIGLGGLSPDELMKFAEALTGEGQITHNHVFKVSAFDMYSAMVAADALGRSRKSVSNYKE